MFEASILNRAKPDFIWAEAEEYWSWSRVEIFYQK